MPLYFIWSFVLEPSKPPPEDLVGVFSAAKWVKNLPILECTSTDVALIPPRKKEKYIRHQINGFFLYRTNMSTVSLSD